LQNIGEVTVVDFAPAVHGPQHSKSM